MSLSVVQLPLGPLQTNCYLMACTVTQQAAVVDPAWDGRAILAQATQHGWIGRRSRWPPGPSCSRFY